MSIPFIPATEDTNSDDMDENYREGCETDTDANEGDVERIQTDFPQTVFCKHADYTLENIDFDTSGADIESVTIFL